MGCGFLGLTPPPPRASPHPSVRCMFLAWRFRQKDSGPRRPPATAQISATASLTSPRRMWGPLDTSGPDTGIGRVSSCCWTKLRVTLLFLVL